MSASNPENPLFWAVALAMVFIFGLYFYQMITGTKGTVSGLNGANGDFTV